MSKVTDRDWFGGRPAARAVFAAIAAVPAIRDVRIHGIAELQAEDVEC